MLKGILISLALLISGPVVAAECITKENNLTTFTNLEKYGKTDFFDIKDTANVLLFAAKFSEIVGGDFSYQSKISSISILHVEKNDALVGVFFYDSNGCALGILPMPAVVIDGLLQFIGLEEHG